MTSGTIYYNTSHHVGKVETSLVMKYMQCRNRVDECAKSTGGMVTLELAMLARDYADAHSALIIAIDKADSEASTTQAHASEEATATISPPEDVEPIRCIGSPLRAEILMKARVQVYGFELTVNTPKAVMDEITSLMKAGLIAYTTIGHCKITEKGNIVFDRMLAIQF